jgi:hypothetical protein
VIKEGENVPVLNYLSTMPWRYMGEWRYDLDTIWTYMVSFTSRTLYPRGKSQMYPLYRRLGGPRNRSELCAEEKDLFNPCPVALETELSRLQWKYDIKPNLKDVLLRC